MNKDGHVLNAVLLSIGLGVAFHPEFSVETVGSIVEIGIPVVIGALFPDIDTVFGTHRVTLHNLPVLGLFVAFPVFFGNLSFVWIGVLTHYVLDLLGTKGGLALLYPYSRMFTLPVGVSVDSNLTTVVTLLVTGVELLAVVVLLQTGFVDVLSTTEILDAATNWSSWLESVRAPPV